MAVSIRRAGASDADAILALLSASELTGEGLVEDAAVILVGWDAGKVAVCGAIETDGVDGLLRSVAVAEESRGRGLGKAVVDRIEHEARSRGLSRLYLLTNTAEGFFERLGYESLDRSLVPAVVRRSAEFAACSAADATAMVRTL
jgi:amino-acid N-acetyltransferase